MSEKTDELRTIVDKLTEHGLESVTFHWKRGTDSIPVESLFGYLLRSLEHKRVNAE